MFILTHVLLKLAVLHLFGVLKSLCGKIIIVAYYKKVKHFKEIAFKVQSFRFSELRVM